MCGEGKHENHHKIWSNLVFGGREEKEKKIYLVWLWGIAKRRQNVTYLGARGALFEPAWVMPSVGRSGQPNWQCEIAFDQNDQSW